MPRDQFHQRIRNARRVIAQENAAGRPFSDATLAAHREWIGASWLCGDAERSWSVHQDLIRLLVRRHRENGTDVDLHLWDGSPRNGRSLLIHATEAGFGDLIQFSRFLAALDPADGDIHVHTRPELRDLFVQSFDPRIRFFDRSQGSSLEALDLETPILETMWFEVPLLVRWTFEQSAAAVPYLKPCASLVERWRGDVLDALASPRIGLCWTSSPPGRWRDERSMALAACRPLFESIESDQGSFISLVKDSRGDEIEEAGLTGRIVDVGDRLSDFAETAALVSQLDLVLSIDTALGHLGGALGRPTWLLLNHEACDRWNAELDPTQVRDYPHMRLFRQSVPGDWLELIDRVAQELTSVELSR